MVESFLHLLSGTPVSIVWIHTTEMKAQKWQSSSLLLRKGYQISLFWTGTNIDFWPNPTEVVCLLLIVCLPHFKGSKGHVLRITPQGPSYMVRWDCEFDLPSILQEAKS